MLLAALAVAAFHFSGGTPASADGAMSYEELTGSIFLPPPKEPYRPPGVRELSLPQAPAATAIWGAFGRDQSGHIWVGVSASRRGSSAQLMEYDPAADSWHDRGSVVERLKAAGLHREGERQVKIHTKIVPASDGWLYFASTDEEESESASGGRLPRWGGHLWRIHPQRHEWQHLVTVPEALIAVSGVGRYIYALGYWGHVLYQYDTQTGVAKRVEVGSMGGHVSRNFIADARGHAYVPRLKPRPDGQAAATLVEYDTNLKEMASTRLDFYLDKEGSPGANHGIVGLAYLPDGRMLFATHPGHLYQIDPHHTEGAKRARVTPLGWLHPDGKPAYVPSLFVLAGNALVGGVVQRGRAYEWIVFDLASRASLAFPLDTKGLQRLLLYGSISRDNDGRFYVGGWTARDESGQRPVVLQIDPGK